MTTTGGGDGAHTQRMLVAVEDRGRQIRQPNGVAVQVLSGEVGVEWT
ncbi:MAG: hypothetical protein PVH95_06340 [Anaerolineae bacterium]|jgi:hypothetical protein